MFTANRHAYSFWQNKVLGFRLSIAGSSKTVWGMTLWLCLQPIIQSEAECAFQYTIHIVPSWFFRAGSDDFKGWQCFNPQAKPCQLVVTEVQKPFQLLNLSTKEHVWEFPAGPEDLLEQNWCQSHAEHAQSLLTPSQNIALATCAKPETFLSCLTHTSLKTFVVLIRNY